MAKPREPDNDDHRQLDLTGLDRDFAAAAPLPRPSALPDGRYHVRVEHVTLTMSRATERPILKWRLRVVGPLGQGRVLWKNHVMATPSNLRWLKHDLRLCGLDLEKLSDLPARLDELLDVELEINKRTRGDWENVHFNRRLAADSPSGLDTPF